LIEFSERKKKKMVIYLIGSLRNPRVPEVAKYLRSLGNDEVFDDWFAPGPEADDFWRKYSQARGHSYTDALKSYSGTHIFEFDKFHLDRADCGILVLPAGKSGHLELGYLIGQGKSGYILFDGQPEPERWDVMYQFAKGVFFNVEEMGQEISRVSEAHSKLV
jgi:nucleoside 2-deoxyribosyltransferase